jgi:predicted nucleotidyltransferase
MAEFNLQHLPDINHRKRVPRRAIRAIVKIIADKFNPDQVILFGSHAYGRPKPWSDVDLLVVMDTPEDEWSLTKAIKLGLPACSFSLDILVRSQAKITQRLAMGDGFMQEITDKGQVLYERNHSRVGRQGRKRLRRRTNGAGKTRRSHH